METLSRELRSVMARLSEVEGKMFELKMENVSLREEIDKLKTTEQSEVSKVPSSCPDQSDLIHQQQQEICSLRKEVKGMKKFQQTVDKKGNSLQDVLEKINRVEDNCLELARKFESVYQMWAEGEMQKQFEFESLESKKDRFKVMRTIHQVLELVSSSSPSRPSNAHALPCLSL